MAQAKILVVEDEKNIVRVVRYNLEREGYQVSAAADGAQALEQVRRERPDLVLLDLMLPTVDGLEVCRQLRADPKTARMNADLTMGDELLKKTGAGNLFTVFGEPDIEVKKQKDGKLVVEIKGVDVYDPTTGQIRSHSTDDIACWFVDTDYNGESFFVRHAYFCGADEPYEKLKKVLRAEINEQAWAALYSTKSRPINPPSNGKIAIKVINHYGDEVLKIYDVQGSGKKQTEYRDDS